MVLNMLKSRNEWIDIDLSRKHIFPFLAFLNGLITSFYLTTYSTYSCLQGFDIVRHVYRALKIIEYAYITYFFQAIRNS